MLDEVLLKLKHVEQKYEETDHKRDIVERKSV